MRDTAEHTPAGSGEKSSFPIVPALVAGAVALTVIAGAVYWFRAPILDAITSTRDAIVSTLGLGVVPIVAWLAVFAFALGWRCGWFRRYGLWLGSVVLLAAALGALAFFTPANGALSAFTLGGEVSLGGRAGQAVVGPTAWLGSLRLFAVIAIGVAVAAPFVAVAVVVGLGRAALFCWVALAFANSAIAAKLRERRQKKEQSQDMPQGYDQNAQFAYSSPPGYGGRSRSSIRAWLGISGGRRRRRRHGVVPVRRPHFGHFARRSRRRPTPLTRAPSRTPAAAT